MAGKEVSMEDGSGGNGLIAALDALLGGAATTLIAAMAGRLAYHSAEVSKKRRRFFGPEVLWEIPVAVGMALVGEALADYLDLNQTVTTGVVAVLAYLGPRGAQTILANWASKGEG